MKISLFIVVILLVFSGCAETSGSKGGLGNSCNDDQTCDAGLVCNSQKICVQDLCDGVNCEEWEECSAGICIASLGNCNTNGDCTGSQLCDVETHTCSDNLSCTTDCNEWEECNNGECVVKDGFCNYNVDCLGNNIYCDPDDHTCKEITSPCNGITCSNHGFCVERSGEPQCICDKGYEADSLECVDICSTLECSTWETCIDGECIVDSENNRCNSSRDCDEFQLCNEGTHQCYDPCDGVTCYENFQECYMGRCVLKAGYCRESSDCVGGYCENNVCINVCGDKDCGAGVCVGDQNGNPVCDCSEGAFLVDDYCVDPCDGMDCTEYGSCIRLTSDLAICECDNENGYFYYHDQRTCVNPCEDVDCNGHGDCVPENYNTAHCECEEGWEYLTGVVPTCINPENPCEGQICSGHGTCTLTENQPHCDCDDLYSAVNLACLPIEGTCLNPKEIIDNSGTFTSYPRFNEEAGSCGGEVGTDFTYQFNVDTPSFVSIDIESTDPFVFYIREGNCDSGTELLCEQSYNQEIEMTRFFEAGTYFLVLDNSFLEDTPSFHLNISTVDPCEGIDCGENGVCDAENVDNKCICNEGYQDNDNIGYCYEACPENIEEQCGGFGVCQYRNSEKFCNCFNGYQDNDDDGVCELACERGDCGELEARGVCDDSTGPKVCICTEPFVDNGTYGCVENPCNDITCGTNSHCAVTENFEAICECDEGYFMAGGFCKNPCITDDVDCNNHGECVATSATEYHCECDTENNYHPTADQHSCETPCDETITCNNNGSCVADDYQNWHCECDTGYFPTTNGLSCETPCTEDIDCGIGNCIADSLTEFHCECPEDMGYYTSVDGNSCVTPCVESINCDNYGLCIADNINDYTCLCDSRVGYFPNSDRDGCTNPCEENNINCGGFGFCVSDSETEYHCECLTGYQDNDNDYICKPACDDREPCGGYGWCDDSTGEAVCNCIAGYQDNNQDGVCRPNCDTASEELGCRNTGTNHQTGTCDDSEGIAHCVCETGFQDNDFNNTCVETCAGVTIDCTPNDTNHYTGSCTDLSGETVCQCEDGYINIEGRCYQICNANSCNGYSCNYTAEGTKCGCPEGQIQTADLQCVTPNNTCPGSLISVGDYVEGTTIGSSNNYESYFPNCGGAAGAPDNVYNLNLQYRTSIEIMLISSGRYDTFLYLKKGVCNSNATEVACNDDYIDTNSSRIVETLDPGTYYIVVDGFSSEDSGTFSLEIDGQITCEEQSDCPINSTCTEDICVCDPGWTGYTCSESDL